MIPRLKPYLGWQEWITLLQPNQDSVGKFETAFADTFYSQNAIAFPYGRSALWAFLKALDITEAEVILPAYTCSVVAHAVVLSGNRLRFVDINLYDYNMDLDQLEAAINADTRAIVATHLFGYPMDIDRLKVIVQSAETRYGNKIWLIQDCAHSFGAYWNDKLVCNEGDVGLFGLNISKTITSIFGGMLTVNDPELAQKLRNWRDANFRRPSFSKGLRRRLYLSAIYPAFNETLYGLVYWLQKNTHILKRFTDAYHLDEKIHFPPDYQDQMMAVEAQVGLVQISKYHKIIERRQHNAQYYHKNLLNLISDDFVLPPLVKGATYSHYVIRVSDRNAWVNALSIIGIQLGILIEYSMPHMTAYQVYANGEEFPNALLCSQHMINLPVNATLSSRSLDFIIEQVTNLASKQSGPQIKKHMR